MAHAPELIERIRAQTDIVALIGRQVPLRRSGRNHMGRCPFHAERTPSFSVSADKGMYYCFGCQQGGDVFAWVMQMQGLEFGDAVRHLAQRAGIELDDLSPAQKALLQQQLKMGRLLEALNKMLMGKLWGASGAPARRMLAERRVPATAARAWHLGYADDGEALGRKLLAQGFELETLQATGLVGPDQQTPRLMFHGRLTFPIHDLGGRLVGFGGRTLGTGSGAGPKYINSRDSDIFHKRGQLFGLFQAQKAIRTRKQVVLVEGFMDVLAAHGASIEQAVAALGTALTPEHGQTCKRLADEAVLMLDGDAAGERAAAKSALTLLRTGLKVHIAWLPEGEDPASLVQRAGAEALTAVLGQARPAVEALMARAFDRAPPSIEGRVQAATALMPLIDAMGESLERELYVGRLADRVGVEVSTLLAHWQAGKAAKGQPQSAKPERPPSQGSAPRSQRAQPPRPPSPPKAPQKSAPKNTSAPPSEQPEPHALKEWAMVQELLLFTELRPRYLELSEYFETAAVRDFLAALSEQGDDDPQTRARLLAIHVKDAQLRQRLAAFKPLSASALDNEPSQAKRTFEDILRRLKWRHIDSALKQLLQTLRDTERRGEPTDTLLRRKQELTARKRALRGELRQQL